LLNFPRRVIFFEPLSLLFYLVKGDFTSARALIRAHKYFWRNIPGLIKKRKEITYKRNNMKTMKKIVKNSSIVLDYFVFKRSTYNQIWN
jgi:hypothetical protein